MICTDETSKKIESTITSICDYIQKELEARTSVNDMAIQEMIKALAELIKANA